MKKLATALAAVTVAAGAGYLLVRAQKLRRRSGPFFGKVVVITGSSRGLGLALAREFGLQGARLVLNARHAAEVEEARRGLLKRGIVEERDILALPCDLRDRAQAQRMIAAVLERFGAIDVLVNNAGIITVGPFEDQPPEAFTDAIETNYYSALHTTQAVLPAMRARGRGNIVNIASIGGKLAIPHLLPYTASKFALVGFSQGLHAELRSSGIRVTTVCPGLMRTGSHVHARFVGDRKAEYRWFSLGATLPGIAAGVRGAAKKIVRAAAKGRAEIAITPQAMLLARLAQVCPETTVRALSLVNDLLLPAPQHSSNRQLLFGNEVKKSGPSPGPGPQRFPRGPRASTHSSLEAPIFETNIGEEPAEEAGVEGSPF